MNTYVFFVKEFTNLWVFKSQCFQPPNKRGEKKTIENVYLWNTKMEREVAEIK